MESFADKVDKAYEKGIKTPQFEKAIEAIRYVADREADDRKISGIEDINIDVKAREADNRKISGIEEIEL